MEVSEQFAEKAPSFNNEGPRHQTQGISRLIIMPFHDKLSYWPYLVYERYDLEAPFLGFSVWYVVSCVLEWPFFAPRKCKKCSAMIVFAVGIPTARSL